jgi:hypothetical protein
MHEQGIFKRFLEVNEHPKEISDIIRKVDEATKNFHVRLFNSRWYIPDNGFQLELSFAQLRQINAISDNTEVRAPSATGRGTLIAHRLPALKNSSRGTVRNSDMLVQWPSARNVYRGPVQILLGGSYPGARIFRRGPRPFIG